MPPVAQVPAGWSGTGSVFVNQHASHEARHAALTLCLVLLACSPSGGDTAGRPAAPTVRDSAGVTIVENTAPQWLPGEAWSVGRQLTAIGAAEGEPPYQLYRAWDATRLSDGTIAIANSGTSEIRFFDRSGRFLRAVGRRGSGPGEFQGGESPGLRFLTHVEGDTLLAWDLFGQQMSVFSPAGVFLRSARLRHTNRMYFLGGSFGGGVFSDRSMLLVLVNPDNAMRMGLSRQVMRLVRFTADGDSAASFGEFLGSEWFASEMAGGRGMRLVDRPFGKNMTARVGDTSAYVATGDSYEVGVYRMDGTLSALIRKAHEPVAVTPQLVESWRERQLAGASENAQRAMRRDFAKVAPPEFLPPYRTIEVDATSHLWVQEYAVGEQPANEWSVFDRQGAWLGTVALPSGFAVLEIGDGYVLGKEQDDMDVEHIVVYALDKPGRRPGTPGGGR